MRIRMTDDREQRLKRLKRATGESTKSGAIDAAVQHYLSDIRGKESVAGDLTAEQVEALSTPWLPIERETTVGVDGD